MRAETRKKSKGVWTCRPALGLCRGTTDAVVPIHTSRVWGGVARLHAQTSVSAVAGGPVLEESLFDGDGVARHQDGVQVCRFRRPATAGVTNDGAPLGRGALGQATCQRYSAAQGQAGLERITTGFLDLTTDKELAVLQYADRNTRVDQVFTAQVVRDD